MVDLLVDSAAFRDNSQLITIAVRQYIKDHPEVDRWASVTNDSTILVMASIIGKQEKPQVLTIPNRGNLWLPITEPSIDLIRWSIEQQGIPHAKSKPTKTWQTKYPQALSLWNSLTSGSELSTDWKIVHKTEDSSTGRKYELVREAHVISSLKEQLRDTPIIALDFETIGDYPFQTPVGYSFSFIENEGYYIPLTHKNEDNADPNRAWELLLQIVDGPWIAHNSIFELHCLENLGLPTYNDKPEDTMTLAWHMSLPRGLKALSAQILNRKRDTYEDIAKGRPFDEVPLSEALAYACDDAIDSLILWRMWNEHDEREISSLS